MNRSDRCFGMSVSTHVLWFVRECVGRGCCCRCAYFVFCFVSETDRTNLMCTELVIYYYCFVAFNEIYASFLILYVSFSICSCIYLFLYRDTFAHKRWQSGKQIIQFFLPCGSAMNFHLANEMLLNANSITVSIQSLSLLTSLSIEIKQYDKQIEVKSIYYHCFYCWYSFRQLVRDVDAFFTGKI